MTENVRVRVPAKVNLALGVGAVTDDGYHELGTVFQAISLFDEISAESAEMGQYQVAFRGEGAAFLPTDDTNLAIRAAKLLADTTGAGRGVRLMIRKRIPVAGGMAGGSADAAGVLVACNKLWDCGLNESELAVLAAQLGADVPFALVGGTAVGTNRGDLVESIPDGGEYFWALAFSHTGLSTPAVFAEFDRLGNSGDTEISSQLMGALAAGQVREVGRLLSNDLSAAAINLQPTLANTLAIGTDAGALGAVISGSGPTCAFLSDSKAGAQVIADELAKFSGVRTVRLAEAPATGASFQ